MHSSELYHIPSVHISQFVVYQGWGIVDGIATFPWELLGLTMGLRTLPWFRIPKLFRLMRYFSVFVEVEEHFRVSSTVNFNGR
jgi:hypothetical protein